LLVLLAGAGCSGDDSPQAVSAAVITVPPPVSVAPDALPATTAGPATAAPVDGAALLQQALGALAPGYHFTTTVTVDGVVTLVADGDRVGPGTRLTLTGNGGTVAYVITPEGSWALPEGDVWQALDTPPASVDPITALSAPTGITVDAVEGTVVRLTATVSPAALGIGGDAAAALQVVLDNATLKDITYAASVDGKPASVQAAFGPLTDPTPVTAPA
jgi:hypothetical protein